MKKLLKYLKGYEKECVLGPLFKLLEATFELLVPLVVASIVDQGIGRHSIFLPWRRWAFPHGCGIRCWSIFWA